MEVATFVLAVIGVGLSIASLTWQAATFVLSGTRLECELRMGAIGPLMRGFMTMPVKDWTGLTPTIKSQGFTMERVFIVVRNTGRLATSVTGYALKTNTGQRFGTTQAECWEKPLPRRLEPGDSETWSLSSADAYAIAEAVRGMAQLRAQVKNGILEVRAEVEDGAGRKVVSKQALQIDLSKHT
jgi:hypothetical protein